MEGQIFEVVISDMALKSLEQVYEYGIETFAFTAATVFIEELILRIEDSLIVTSCILNAGILLRDQKCIVL